MYLVAQLCLTLWDPWLAWPGSFVHGDFPDNTGVSCHILLQGIFPTQVSGIAGRFFTVWATREAQISFGYLKFKQSRSFPRIETKTFIGNICLVSKLALEIGYIWPVVSNTISQVQLFFFNFLFCSGVWLINIVIVWGEQWSD